MGWKRFEPGMDEPARNTTATMDQAHAGFGRIHVSDGSRSLSFPWPGIGPVRELHRRARQYSGREVARPSSSTPTRRSSAH